MGLFYSNFTLYGPDREAVIDALQKQKRLAFVSPTVDRFTTVYDSETEDQDFEAIERVGRQLSLDHRCPVMGVILHDDDVLYYWLFRDGDLLQMYNSSPAYFSADMEPVPPEGGNAEELCAVFGQPTAANKVESILREDALADDASFAGELERHEALAAALGMPAHAIGIGYNAIDNSYLPDTLPTIAFERIGDEEPG